MLHLYFTRAGEKYELPPFQRAPTLGGECYGTGDHPLVAEIAHLFQRAPTLGGECYDKGTGAHYVRTDSVSTGTHPWG